MDIAETKQYGNDYVTLLTLDGDVSIFSPQRALEPGTRVARVRENGRKAESSSAQTPSSLYSSLTSISLAITLTILWTHQHPTQKLLRPLPRLLLRYLRPRYRQPLRHLHQPSLPPPQKNSTTSVSTRYIVIVANV